MNVTNLNTALLIAGGRQVETPINGVRGIFFSSGGAIVSSARTLSGATVSASGLVIYCYGHTKSEEDIFVSCNAFAYSGAVIKSCSVSSGGRIEARTGSIVRDCTASSGGDIYAYSSGSIVQGCTAFSNGKIFSFMSGSIVKDCTISSGGYLVVSSGATATNITSETGAVITVADGGTITYANQEA